MLTLFLLACQSDNRKPDSDAHQIFHNALFRLNSTQTSDILAVRDGIVVATGADVWNFQDTTTQFIDMEGSIILPGFQDNHTHLLAGSFVFERLLMVGVSHMTTLLSKAEEYANEHPDEEWIVGYGWVHSTLENPSGVALDDVIPDRPAAIFDSSGHALLVNSQTLALASIDANTPSPSGGEIVKDPETGEPTGLLLEAAIELVSSIMTAAIGDQDLASNLESTIGDFNAAGLTSICEILAVPGVRLDRPWLFADLESAGALNLRVHYYMPAFHLDDLDAVAGLKEQYDGDLVRFSGVKLWVDGSMGSGEAWSLDPAVNDPNHYGSYYFDTDTLIPFVQRAEAEGWPLKLHANGDAAVNAVLNALGAVSDQLGSLHQPHLLEHAALVSSSDYHRLNLLGITASVQPAHSIVGLLGDQAQMWNDERFDTIWNFRQLADAGVPLVLGTDWPVWPTPDVMIGLWTASNGVGERSLTLTEAFDGYTHQAAKSIGRENEIGCLQVGCYADMIQTDVDPFGVDANDIANINIDAVWLAGSQVY